MGNRIGKNKVKRDNFIAKLAPIELQLCMHFMDRTSRLRFVRTCRAFLTAGEAPFAWKHLSPYEYTYQVSSVELNSPLAIDRPGRLCRSLVRLMGLDIVWIDPAYRIEPDSPILTREIQKMKEFSHVHSLTISRNQAPPRTIEEILNQNSHLNQLHSFIVTSVGPSIDFIHFGSAILTWKKLQHLELPNIELSFRTYQGLSLLPQLQTLSLSRITVVSKWSTDDLRLVKDLQFSSNFSDLILCRFQFQSPAILHPLLFNLFSQVSHLRIEHCRRQNWKLLLGAFKRVTHLTSVGVDQHERICEQLVESAINKSDLLSNLSFLSISDTGFRRIAIPDQVGPHEFNPRPIDLQLILTARPRLHIQLIPSDAKYDQQIYLEHFRQPLEESHPGRVDLILPNNQLATELKKIRMRE